ncbi:MAG: aminopeptidase [Gammaproteobacteria bacterium]|nr:aminopeptidase [Gammaproteobacteria bacterium]
MYKKNIWLNASDEKKDAIMSFSEGYKSFLSNAKTERLAVKEAKELAIKYGYKELKEFKSLKEGDKVYVVNKDKNFMAIKVGKNKISDGVRVLGAHIDSPRMDLKQNPLYEKDGFTLLDTHYYGGIKKYLWVTIPLALHGVVIKKDGTRVNINIGDDENDPVFGVTDLLIHLSAEQMKKTAGEVVEGENLDLSFSSIPNKEDKSPKTFVLNLLKEKYGIEEEDFISSEIEVVPAGKARDYGIDRSMVAGYGHDDRICAYTSLMGLLESNDLDYTGVVCLVDKEEVGSIGATGAQSRWFENTILKLLTLQGETSLTALSSTLENSYMLSSDVSAGLDPLYSSATPKANGCELGSGIVINKYTGSRGKGGCNDAMPEYLAKVRNIFDSNEIAYQTAEIGRVDLGGGGTIAYILGNLNMFVVDAGIPVLNMHSPMEIASKADIYEGYLAYKAFLEKELKVEY